VLIPCQKALDQSANILGLLWQDYAVILGSFVPFVLVFGLLGGFIATPALALSIYLAKRGKPPGAVLQALHGLEVVRLPGLLPARPTTYTPW
jgi:hypothetical protein